MYSRNKIDLKFYCLLMLQIRQISNLSNLGRQHLTLTTVCQRREITTSEVKWREKKEGEAVSLYTLMKYFTSWQEIPRSHVWDLGTIDIEYIIIVSPTNNNKRRRGKRRDLRIHLFIILVLSFLLSLDVTLYVIREDLNVFAVHAMVNAKAFCNFPWLISL